MFKKLFLFSCLMMLTAWARAASYEQFSNAYTFGDSVSYKGTWTDFLMQRYGIEYTDGRNGFALGGNATTELQSQLSNYMNAVKGYDPNALYLVFMGPSDAARSYNGNLVSGAELSYPREVSDNIASLGVWIPVQDGAELDMADLKNKIAGGQINVNSLLPITIADLDTRAVLLRNFVQTISSGGARYIVVLNNFKNTLRWNAVFSDYMDFFDEIWVSLWNSSIYQRLNELPSSVNIIIVDTNRFLNEVTNNPTKYFTSHDISVSNRQQGYFDANTGANPYHATEAGDRLFSQYVASILESPSRIAMVRELPLQEGSRILRATTSTADRFSNGQISNRFTFEITGDYARSMTGTITKKQLGFNSTDSLGQAALNFRVGERGLLGITLNRSLNDIDFVKNNGSAKIQELGVMTHMIYSAEPVFSYFSAGFGNLDYSIRREIPLGIGKNSELGKTKGVHYLAMVGAGYRRYVDHSFAVTPHINLSYQNVSMKRYQEKGNIGSTAMSYDIPDRASIKTEIALKVEGDFKVNNVPVIPALTIAYGYDFINPIKKAAKARVSDMPRWFSVPTYKMPASSWDLYGSLSLRPKQDFSVALTGSAKPFGRIKAWSVGLALAAGL